jgi:YfiH family protein
VNPPTEPRWKTKSAGKLVYYELAFGEVVAAIATRQGGVSAEPFDSLNLSPEVGDLPESVARNRGLLEEALELARLTTLTQVHSDRVHVVPFEGKGVHEGDALHTPEPWIGLGVKVADCLPVYVFAQDASCVGIAHCGWRGTAACTAGKLAVRMSEHHGIPAFELRFTTGPCICPECYEVGPDVFEEFRRSFPDHSRFLTPSADKDQTWHLDLRAANRHLLTGIGLQETASLDLCTFENPDLFYSARRERVTGRNLAVISIKDRQ